MNARGRMMSALAPLLLSAAAAPPGSSLERLADQLTLAIVKAQPEPPVALAVDGDSVPLARALATLLSARLVARKLAPTVLEVGADRAETTARGGGFRTLVRLSVGVQESQLVARGDVLGTWVNFWSGKCATRPPAPAAALQISVEADTQSLAWVPKSSVPSASAELKLTDTLWAKLSVPVAALAAGDLDGDGKDELLALGGEELWAFRADGKVLAHQDLTGAPDTSTRCREPFGALAVLGRPVRVAVWSAGKQRSLEWVLEGNTLKVRGEVTDVLAGAAEQVFRLRWRLGTNAFSLLPPSAESIETSSGISSVSVCGGQRPTVLFVSPDGRGTLSDGKSGPWATFTGLGAGSAVLDIDGDGECDLATSLSTHTPQVERLEVLTSIRRYARTGTVALPSSGAKLPLGATRLVALTAVRFQDDGSQELLGALTQADGTTQLHLFRRVR